VPIEEKNTKRTWGREKKLEIGGARGEGQFLNQKNTSWEIGKKMDCRGTSEGGETGDRRDTSLGTKVHQTKDSVNGPLIDEKAEKKASPGSCKRKKILSQFTTLVGKRKKKKKVNMKRGAMLGKGDRKNIPSTDALKRFKEKVTGGAKSQAGGKKMANAKVVRKG